MSGEIIENSKPIASRTSLRLGELEPRMTVIKLSVDCIQIFLVDQLDSIWRKFVPNVKVVWVVKTVFRRVLDGDRVVGFP